MMLSTFFLIGALLIALIVFLVDHLWVKRNTVLKNTGNENIILRDPPGPFPWPVWGSLHIMGKHEVPFKAFDYLRDFYDSDVIKIKLGSFQCIVVNGVKNIREVLLKKGTHFNSRPQFSRIEALFRDDRENSLAFCDWSDIQKLRRGMLKPYTLPYTFSYKFNKLNNLISIDVNILLDVVARSNGESLKIKKILLQTCGNIFTNYFCSKHFSTSHQAFAQMVDTFDKVFYEVNSGYLVDFLPWLMPFYAHKTRNLKKWSHEIREFVNKHIIQNRLEEWHSDISDNDFVDSLLRYTKSNVKPAMSWDMSLFALEDVIGGHSAVGNFLMKVFGYLVSRPHVQKAAQNEIDNVAVNNNIVELQNIHSMPYIQAIILETIRMICSPIVPHVAIRDTSVAGFKVEKDNVIFFNNYDLHMSNKLWTKPNEFLPERFIRNGLIVKPEHFIPFGGGCRSCLGYKLVQFISFTIIANILKNFTILPAEGEKYNIPIGNVAIDLDTYSLRFKKR